MVAQDLPDPQSMRRPTGCRDVKLSVTPGEPTIIFKAGRLPAPFKKA
jgi:hypothetical protein